MLVVDIPTGYLMEQPTADRIVRSGVVPEMRDADVLKSGKTIWYFDHIPNVTRCFDHTVSLNLIMVFNSGQLKVASSQKVFHCGSNLPKNMPNLYPEHYLST